MGQTWEAGIPPPPALLLSGWLSLACSQIAKYIRS